MSSHNKNRIIINICHGGLGNRLKPLSSCFALAQYSKRELGVIWGTHKWCEAKFSDLFINDFKIYSLDWVMSQKSLSFYANEADVYNYYHELIPVVKKFGCRKIKLNKMLKDPSDTILVITNDYINGIKSKDCKFFFDSLSPIPEILDKIKSVERKIILDKSFIGVHARGTDFETGGVTYYTYLNEMRKECAKKKDLKFFICSDSNDYEKMIKESLPNVYINQKENYVSKLNQNEKWANNIKRPCEAVQDALVDMYLLSKTNFKIYNKYSTFAHIVNMMSKGILQRNVYNNHKKNYLHAFLLRLKINIFFK